MSKRRKKTSPVPIAPLHHLCANALNRGCGLLLCCDECWRRVFGK